MTVLTPEPPAHVSLNMPFSKPAFKVVHVPLPNWVQALQRKFHGTPTNTKPSLTAKKGTYKPNFFRKKISEVRSKTGIFSSCRMPDFYSWWARDAYRALDTQTWDLVVSTYPPYGPHYVAQRLRREGRAKQWIADFRDPWTKHQVYQGLFPFTIREYLLERRMIREADLITTVSQPLAAQLEKKKPKRPVAVIENGVTQSALQALDPAPFFKASDKFRIAFTGTIYEDDHNPYPLFAALAALHADASTSAVADRIELVFAGRPSPLIESLTKQFNLESCVHFLGSVAHSDALRIQRDADLLLLTVLKAYYPGMVGGKIFEYGSSGTPVLSVGGHPDDSSAELISRYNLGWVCGEDQSAIKTLLKKLVNHGTAAERHKSQQSDFTRDFDRSEIARKMLRAVTSTEGVVQKQ